MKRAPLAIVGGLLVLAALVPLAGGQLGGAQPSPTPRLGPTASAVAVVPGSTGGSADASATPADATPADATPSAPAPAPSTAEPPTPTGPVQAAVVPVTQFRTTRTSTDTATVKAILDGSSTRYDALELVASDADPILAALGVDASAAGDRLVLAPDAATLTRDLARHRKRLAFLRAEEVTPAVRALAWGKTALFGTTRVRTLADWPLVVTLPASGEAVTPFDPAATWTMFAGGDILLDRGVYETVRVKGKGVDFPFDGGTAEITGHCKDCSPLGWDTPYTKRTGNKGAVRKLISGADLAIANFENPAPKRWTWHTSKTVFSADPGIIDGLVDAGIDYVGIANNHIGDAGRAGITQTIANLKKRGLVFSGAGKNEAAARKPAMIEVDGTRVAILAYDAIQARYHAGAETIGSAGFSVKKIKADIRKARAAGADVVVVFPHWGIEYRYAPTPTQRQQAHAILDAGADMIIGNHAHYATAMEVYDGKPIWYALGNLVFDQTWSEPTMEGITLELTFAGKELAQVRIRPHLILDKSQPNFLDPAGDGKVVLDKVYKGAPGLLPW